MPEVGDYSRHLQGVDAHILQQSSNQGGWRSCSRAGVKSEIINYNTCVGCFDAKLAADQKPLLLDIRWKSTEIVNIVPETPFQAAILLPAANHNLATPEAETGAFGSRRVTRTRAAPSDERDLHARTSSTSPYLQSHPQRGRPPNGSRVGRIGFKGVRQRKGVRGYLVEIRPPKWKKTIWLGTYNSDREAAGAYDAGIFYTNKKTKFNFPSLEGTFPPLPSHLRLDNADDNEDIKTFVQREAREAARKVKGLPAPPPPPPFQALAPPASELLPSTWTDQLCGDDVEPTPNVPVSSATSSSEDSESCSDLVIPEVDWPFFQQMESPCWDLTWVPFDCMKQEEISLGSDLDADGVNSGFLHSLV